MTLTPYLVAKHAEAAIAFYAEVFGATEDFRMTDPGDGRIGHAELRFAGAPMMLSDEYPDFGAISPDALGGSPVLLHLQCDDVDAMTRRAIDAGAVLLRPLTTQSFGERNALVLDPFGHRWMLSQTTEQVAPDEMQRRWEDGTP